MEKQVLLDQINSDNVPQHIAIIMDGNRRWAQKNGFEIQEGYNFGAKQIEHIVNIALEIKVKMLTLYAFSSENWNRNKTEIIYLMSILREYLSSDYANSLINNNVKFIAIGDIDKFDQDIIDKINFLQEKTKNNNALILCFTLSYGGKSEIVNAVKKIAQNVLDNKLTINNIDENIIHKEMFLAEYPLPDLMIRSGGEKRISNFLLWYIAYSELYFSDKMWPEFNELDFLLAIIDYQLRERRYGRN